MGALMERPSSSWSKPSTTTAVEEALRGRQLCPELSPLASKLSCCPSVASSMMYRERSLGGASATMAYMRNTSIAAAQQLRRRRVVTVGDSVMQQWTNALLLDLAGSFRLTTGRSLRLPSGRWTKHEVPWPTLIQDNKYSATYCDATPSKLFNASALDAAAPHVAFFSLHTGICMHPPHSECCHGEAPPVRALVRFLQAFKPDIVVTNYGVHWHGQQTETEGSYRHDVAHLITALDHYGRGRDRVPLAVGMLETFPQHFPGPLGDGSFDTRDPRDGCAPLSLGKTGRNFTKGPLAMNRLLRQAVESRPSLHVNISVLPVFNAFASRYDAHHSQSDCTHLCYSALLWDAALLPFYKLVLETWGGP